MRTADRLFCPVRVVEVAVCGIRGLAVLPVRNPCGILADFELELLRDQIRVVRLLVRHLSLHRQEVGEGEGRIAGLRLNLEDGDVLGAFERVELPVART